MNHCVSSMSRSATLTVFLALGLLSGCGNLDSSSVQGTVSYKGTPLSAGTVIFESGNHTCTGRIENGKYILRCKGKTNIPLADYEITVFPPQPEVKTNPETLELEAVSTVDESAYPARYRSRKTSELAFTPVKGKNEFAIVLTD